MSNEETIENLVRRLTLLSNVMTSMFQVVARHIPATNDEFRGLVYKWEEIEKKFPLPNEDK